MTLLLLPGLLVLPLLLPPLDEELVAVDSPAEVAAADDALLVPPAEEPALFAADEEPCDGALVERDVAPDTEELRPRLLACVDDDTPLTPEVAPLELEVTVAPASGTSPASRHTPLGTSHASPFSHGALTEHTG